MRELKIPTCWVVFFRGHRCKNWHPIVIRTSASAGRTALWNQVNNGESGHHILMRVAGWKVEPFELAKPKKASKR